MRIKVKSGHIDSVEHDPEMNTLDVKFKSGKSYRYHDVDSDEHDQLINADSVGSVFHRTIKTKKKVTRL